jgi:FkbM family methyltransferase
MKGFPAKDDFHPVVVDIGAHAGYFAFSALSLGARRVYCVEPFPDNFKMLLKNIGENPIDVFVPYFMGINEREDRLPMNYPELSKENYFDFANIDISPDAAMKYLAPMVPLNTFLRDYVREKVDLLKISIGYSELDILDRSEAIRDVQNVCGEATLEAEKVEFFKRMMAGNGFLGSRVDPVEGEEGKYQFFFAKSKLTDMFVF